MPALSKLANDLKLPCNVRFQLPRLVLTCVFAMLFASQLSAQPSPSQLPAFGAEQFQDRRIPTPSWSGRAETIPSPQPQSPGPGREIKNMEFQNAPIERVVELFSMESGLNVRVSENAKGKDVTVSIRNMPALDALREFTKQTGTYFIRDSSTGVFTIFLEQDRDPNVWDTQSLKEFQREINEAFPDSIVRLSSVGKQLIVRGQAHDVVEASRIIRLIDAEAKSKKGIKGQDDPPRTTTEMTQRGGMFGATQFLQRSEPELTVIDMLTVTGNQQVSLRVTVAEVDRSAARSIGLNFGIKGGPNTTTTNTTVTPNGTTTSTNTPNVFQSLVGAQTLGAGNLPTMLDNGQIQLAINALRSMSLAKTLAEPTLTSLNGQQASFHAGGQFPVPIVTGQTNTGLQGVSFVPFGINLQFTPYITDRDRIRLNVSAEVSSRTQGQAPGSQATIGGAVIPGLDMRKFQTIVELRQGQTLAVAGLISNNQNMQADRVPFFGDLPVIGRLAAFDRVTAREQELVILVTPELVQPLSAEERLNLPGSDVFEPGDVEFYLGGYLEGNRNEDFRSPSRTDLHRQKSFYHARDQFITGPHGYTECGPMPGAFQ